MIGVQYVCQSVIGCGLLLPYTEICATAVVSRGHASNSWGAHILTSLRKSYGICSFGKGESIELLVGLIYL